MASSVPSLSPADILALRKRHLNPSLSVSYVDPIKIVRGKGAYLYDDQGLSYLDMVNNVCHVGHCHPTVVAAGQQQMAKLNTNTRYLHDNIVQYAQRLAATFPPELSVVFLTNSGTEANDLAIRIARTYTQANDLIVVDHAYHGNSPSQIDISPYKFNGKGGSGKMPHVQVVQIPDPYRGPYKLSDPLCGEHYATDVLRAVTDIAARGEKPAAFFCESVLGCGGQVVLPPSYLRAAYGRLVRSRRGTPHPLVLLLPSPKYYNSPLQGPSWLREEWNLFLGV
jgi:4-aminobutyrate aminotransferase-like enzyme